MLHLQRGAALWHTGAVCTVCALLPSDDGAAAAAAEEEEDDDDDDDDDKASFFVFFKINFRWTSWLHYKTKYW